MKNNDDTIFKISSNLILDISSEIMDGFKEITLYLFREETIKNK